MNCIDCLFLPGNATVSFLICSPTVCSKVDALLSFASKDGTKRKLKINWKRSTQKMHTFINTNKKKPSSSLKGKAHCITKSVHQMFTIMQGGISKNVISFVHRHFFGDGGELTQV